LLPLSPHSYFFKPLDFFHYFLSTETLYAYLSSLSTSPFSSNSPSPFFTLLISRFYASSLLDINSFCSRPFLPFLVGIPTSWFCPILLCFVLLYTHCLPCFTFNLLLPLMFSLSCALLVLPVLPLHHGFARGQGAPPPPPSHSPFHFDFFLQPLVPR